MPSYESAAPLGERATYRHVLRTTLGFAVFGILWIAATFALVFAVRFFWPELLAAPWFSLVMNVVPLYGIAFPVLLLIVKGVPTTPIEKHKLSFSEFSLLFAPMFTFVIMGSLMGNVVNTVFDLFPYFDTGGSVGDALSGDGFLWMAVATVIVAPVMEELVFRKLLISRLLAVGEFPAILISGLFFGLFHMNFEQFFYAFFLGVIFGWVFVKTGKLIYTVLLHLIVNFFAGLLPSLLALIASLEGLSEISYALCMWQLLSYSLAEYLTAGLGILVLCLFGRQIVRSIRPSPYSFGEQVRLLYLNPGTVVMVVFCACMFFFNMLSI